MFAGQHCSADTPSAYDVIAEPHAAHLIPVYFVELTGYPCAIEEEVESTQRKESNGRVGVRELNSVPI